MPPCPTQSDPSRAPSTGGDRPICNRRGFILEWAFHKRRAIEADEAAIGPKPEITVTFLGDRKDVAEQHVVLRSPGGEGVAGRVRRFLARLGNVGGAHSSTTSIVVTDPAVVRVEGVLTLGPEL